MSDHDNKMLWGVSTWIFLHTMAARITDKGYIKLRGQLLSITKKICSNLPCPHCAQHATKFMNRVQPNSIPNRLVYQSMLFQFHNSVNMRLGKPPFPLEKLEEAALKNMETLKVDFL